MKALTWDAATQLFKQVITGRIFTDSSEPVDIADGDLWIDSSSTPVLKARVAGTIYEVVGAGGGGGGGPALLADDIVNEALVANPAAADETETLPFELHTIDDTVASVTLDTLRPVIQGLSPAGYWKLDDALSPPQDSSGNARHASATTGATYRTTVGGGPGNYVTLPTNNKIPVTNNNAFEVNTAPGLTIFFLARPTAAPASYSMFVCVGPSSWEYAISQQPDGAIHAFTMTSAGVTVTRTETAAGTVALNQWQAICVTISDITTGATIDVYKNSNTALAKTVVTGAGSAPTSNTAVMQIGAQTDLTTRGMAGSMAHFAIFPGVMSGANIQTIMDAADADGWF